MNASLTFTVAQGKRLIAKAVSKLPEVISALSEGTIAIGRGTTNGYVAEEIMGHLIPKGEYVSGRILPAGMPWEELGRGGYPDIVLKNGEVVNGGSVINSVADMKSGDVFIKGANALDYKNKIAGVLMMHPTGGTLSVYGALISKKINLIIPVGLEKIVTDDITELSMLSRESNCHPKAPVVSLMPITGNIITEIEALDILCGVKAKLLSAGGVKGAEGAVTLFITGEQGAVDNAVSLHSLISDEPGI
jgi:hypothetical protein